MERLENMKETLMNCVQGQLGHLDTVDTKELGEVIDMIKDLEEAIYYKTITEAMEETEHYRDMDKDLGRRYYTPGKGEKIDEYYNYPYRYNNYREPGTYQDGFERVLPMEMTRDKREGRSPMERKMYMESKELHKDKAIQMKELEAYMHDLSEDITEMIEGASPEERQILLQKLNTLITKIH